MKVTTAPPEPHMVLTLQPNVDGTVTLCAEIDEDFQRLMTFSTEKPGGPMIAHTFKLRDCFPVETDAHGHIVTRMKM